MKTLPRWLTVHCSTWLFICFQLFYLLTASGRLHTVDEYETFYMTESLAENGELSIPAGKGFFGRKSLDGRFHAPYGPLLSVAASPGYVAGSVGSKLLGHPPAKKEALAWFSTSLVNTTISAAGVVVFFLLLLKLGAAPLPALFTTIVFAVATPHWHYATTFFSEPLSTLLLLVSVYLLAAQWKEQRDEPQPMAFLLAGLPLALTAANRLTMAIYFPLLAAAVLALFGRRLRERLLAAAAYCALPLCAVGLYLLWNYVRFGAPFEIGYPAAIEGARSPIGFGEPLPRGLFGLILSPGKGLFLFAMPALVGLFLSSDFIRRTRTLGVFLLLVPCVPLLFYASYSYWEGGHCWGPRFLVPAIGFWILPLAFLQTAGPLARGAAIVAALFSCLLQALGVSVSFLECQVPSSLFQPGYYHDGHVYNMGYSAIAETLTVFLHYWNEAVSGGRFLAESEGLGFDRWFFFLSKSGFSVVYLVLAVTTLMALLGICVFVLGRALALLREEYVTARRPRQKDLLAI
ncbi:MAG: hypothetical protein JXA90_04995 [Planctomycetes bacterium]|nr:hypothetical protein [Planctomycetota bacterium]